MKRIQIVIFLITLSVIMYVISKTQTFEQKNSIESTPTPICKETQMCPPCLTDDQGKPVGECNCVTVKKCEPR